MKAARSGPTLTQVPLVSLKSSATRPLNITPAQSPTLRWRNSRMLGYHGLSGRSISQRQSGV